MGNCFGSEETELEGVNTPGQYRQPQPQATASRSLPRMSAPNARQSQGSSMSVITSRSTNGAGNISAAFLEPEEGMILEVPNLRIFTFAELKAATRNFKPDTVLGEGGFGRVYKGWVDKKTMNPMSSSVGSAMVIAVKKLKPGSSQGLEEWQCEVNFLGRMSHPNLVRLLGYCLEERELLLVYEFMAKGSLENHLFRIVTLFDSRFRLAILSHLYVKSDVYGFGVVLLEMLTGLRALDTARPAPQLNLVNWAKPYLADRRRLPQLVDPHLEGQYTPRAALRAAQLTMSCLAGDPKNRPSMAEVVAALEKIERMKPPPHRLISPRAAARTMHGRTQTRIPTRTAMLH
uniref:non-specific serine/threonine protein kinase n=1 Tax=Aegilops tauschii TaxID=37682 RepID=M8BMH4_AEGTA